jgi:hypothetical protein
MSKLLVSAAGSICSVRSIPGEGVPPLTAAEYLFAVGMTLLIVWIVSEVGQRALKG